MDDAQISTDAGVAQAMADIAREAGARAMSWFRDGSRTHARIDWKHGGSPVTQADLEIDAFLRERLGSLLPEAGWLSEETADTPERLQSRAIFVVDPIDGTRGFMEGDPRFAISIALVIDGRPAIAVIEAPAVEERFFARAGEGAFLNGERVSLPKSEPVSPARLAGPKFLIEPVARLLGMTALPKIPSLALRLARVASGEIEAAVASRDAHDWDIAAADLLLEEAGATLLDLDGRELTYNNATTKHDILIAAPTALQPGLRAAVSDVVAQWRNDQVRRTNRM